MKLYLCQNKNLPEPLNTLKSTDQILITETGDVYLPNNPDPIYITPPDEKFPFDKLSKYIQFDIGLSVKGSKSISDLYLFHDSYKQKLLDCFNQSPNSRITGSFLAEYLSIPHKDANNICVGLVKQKILRRNYTWYELANKPEK